MERHGTAEHRHRAPKTIQAFVLTVSDTRTPAEDRSGDLVRQLLEEAGHDVLGRRVVPDEVDAIQGALRRFLGLRDFTIILVTGGTGISHRDVTPEAVKPMFDKELSGFGELFRMLSYQEIGAASMLSRAVAGVIGRSAVFVMPGSQAAVSLAMSRLILPEAGHIVYELRKHASGETR